MPGWRTCRSKDRAALRQKCWRASPPVEVGEHRAIFAAALQDLPPGLSLPCSHLSWAVPHCQGEQGTLQTTVWFHFTHLEEEP